MEKEKFLTSMAKLIMVVSLIVGIGAVMGLMGYLNSITDRDVVIINEVKNEILQNKLDEISGWKTYRNDDYVLSLNIQTMIYMF